MNHAKQSLTNAVLTDSLGDSGMAYIPSSFELSKVVFDDYGNVEQELETWTGDHLTASGKLTFSADTVSFTLNLGTTNNQYYLRYKSTYTPGAILKNQLRMESGGEGLEKRGVVPVRQFGGLGQRRPCQQNQTYQGRRR